METLEKSEQAFTREYAERVERCIEAAKKSFFPEDTLEIFDEVNALTLTQTLAPNPSN